MTATIPRLANVGKDSIPLDFVVRFVEVHGGDWNVAQDHWEKIVQKVLQTDAVDPQAKSTEAINQAVRASIILLSSLPNNVDRCPLCIERLFSRLGPPPGSQQGHKDGQSEGTGGSV